MFTWHIVSIWLTCPSPTSGQEKTYWSWKTMLKTTSLIIFSSTLPRRDSPSLQEEESRVWDHGNIRARHGVLCNEPTLPHWPKKHNFITFFFPMTDSVVITLVFIVWFWISNKPLQMIAAYYISRKSTQHLRWTHSTVQTFFFNYF